jgi:hypothetical protein
MPKNKLNYLDYSPHDCLQYFQDCFRMAFCAARCTKSLANMFCKEPYDVYIWGSTFVVNVHYRHNLMFNKHSI